MIGEVIERHQSSFNNHLISYYMLKRSNPEHKYQTLSALVSIPDKIKLHPWNTNQTAIIERIFSTIPNPGINPMTVATKRMIILVRNFPAPICPSLPIAFEPFNNPYPINSNTNAKIARIPPMIPPINGIQPIITPTNPNITAILSLETPCSPTESKDVLILPSP